MSQNKICILHDTFLYKGGGERLILMMGKTLQADIASGFFSQGSFDLRKEGFRGEMIPLSSEVSKKGWRHIKLKFAFLFRTRFLQKYDTVLFSGDSISGIRNCSKKSLKVYYCHTPPRYIYDLHEHYLRRLSGIKKISFLLGCKIFRFLYERDITKIDIIITNSQNTQKRIKKYLGLESRIIYPPVESSKFRYLGEGDYFLSFARLADAKRVDMLVRAFQKLPHEKLIVIYGKNDPQKDKILELAAGYKNIECITLENNDELYEYVGYARATLYIPIEEDFGMSPVESMSAGKPVLGVREGGLKESIIHKKTGFLLEPDFCVDDILKALEFFSQESCLAMREACEQQASNFSLESFESQLQEILSQAK